MQETYAEDEAHEEATDVGEVVEAREETEHEGHDDADADPREVDPRGAALGPVVEEIKQHQGNDAEEAAGRATGGDPFGGEVAAEHEPEDAAAEVHERVAERANVFFHFAAHGQLQEHIKANVHEAGVEEHGDDEPVPLPGVIGSGMVITKAAELGERALVHRAIVIRGGGVGAAELEFGVVLDLRGCTHTRNVASAHINEDVG